MSGAKKKLAQKEALSQLGLTEKEKKAQKEAAAKKRNTILAVIGGVIVAVLVVVLLVWNSGFFSRHTTALEVNGHKYSVADMDYFYRQIVNNAYSNELSTAQLYQQYELGDYTPAFDPSLDLKTQYVDEEQTQSFHDYFLEQAQEQVAQITALADAAKAAGHTLSESAQEQWDNALTDLDTQARSANLAGRSAFLRVAYGRNVNEKVYLDNVRMTILAGDYSSAVTEPMQDPSEEDLKAYYEEHTDLYNSYDYDYAYFDGQPAKETGENGDSIEPTDEQKSQAMADAKAKAEDLLKAAKDAQTATLGEGETRQTFAQTALSFGVTDTTRTRVLGATIQNTVYGEWVMDSARKDGDTEMFEAENAGYYVIQFHDSYFYDEPTVDVRHILVRAETSEDAQIDEVTGVPVPTQEQMDAAKAKAEDLMKQFNLGEKTAAAFGEMAEEHSDDGRNDDGTLYTEGGLYQNIHKGDMVPNFNDWIFDTSRQEGDVGLVENAGPGYYGWHVIYFQATHEPEWIGGSNGARNAKSTADQNAWLESVEEGYDPAPTAAMSKVGL